MVRPFFLIHYQCFLAYPDTTPSVVTNRAVTFTSLLARRLILFDWRLARPSSHGRWIKEVLYNLNLEKLRLSLKGSAKTFQSSWSPFLSHVNSLSLAPDSDEA